MQGGRERLLRGRPSLDQLPASTSSVQWLDEYVPEGDMSTEKGWSGRRGTGGHWVEDVRGGGAIGMDEHKSNRYPVACALASHEIGQGQDESIP